MEMTPLRNPIKQSKSYALPDRLPSIVEAVHKSGLRAEALESKLDG
jgi:hypothetical protein